MHLKKIKKKINIYKIYGKILKLKEARMNSSFMSIMHIDTKI